MANTRRMNRLEELGRVDAEKAKTRKGKRNLRQEKSRIVRELKKEGGEVKPKKTPRDQKQQRRMGDRSKSGVIKIIEVRKKDGGKIGGLKKPTPDQKGLKKLPTKVRNKMGYMRKGGRVKSKEDAEKLLQIKKAPKPQGKRRSYQEVRRDRGMGKALRGGGCVR
jgi:hypothetical protein